MMRREREKVVVASTNPLIDPGRPCSAWSQQDSPLPPPPVVEHRLPRVQRTVCQLAVVVVVVGVWLALLPCRTSSASSSLHSLLPLPHSSSSLKMHT